MYIIDSSIEVPDLEYLEDRVTQLMSDGIAIKDLGKLLNKANYYKETATETLKEQYGIQNPNSTDQIVRYYVSVLNKEIADVFNRLNVTANKIDLMDYVYILLGEGYKSVTPKALKLYDIESLSSDVDTVIKCMDKLMSNDILCAMYKNGKWTTNKAAMHQLALKGHQDAIDILTYRKIKKYVETLNTFKGAVAGDGFVHPTVSVGKTNRINYSNPALMNIPKQLLWDVVRPRIPDNILVSVDIKQQEPWIVINTLGISELKHILEEHSDSLYEEIFYRIFDRYPEPIERKEVKQAWNAMTYGASIKGIEEICQNIDGKAVYKYFNSIPEFKQYKARCNKLAKNNVQLCKTYFGTELYANERGSKLSRVLMDLPIQGTGADILALLVKHFDECMEEQGLSEMISLYYTRHDEVILEIDREFIDKNGRDKVFEFLSDIFEHRVDDWEPFKVEIKELNGTEDIETYIASEDEEE